ncbi:MAG: branched-chain amino acid ABC transporter permease [Acidimicrobiia bacterium]
MTKLAEETALEAPSSLADAYEWGKVARWGLFAGITFAFVASIGAVERLSDRFVIDPILNMGYAAIIWIPLAFGYIASRKPSFEGLPAPVNDRTNVIAGALAGLIGGVVASGFLVLIDAVDLRSVFRNISPALLDLLTFGRGLGFGIAVLVVPGVVLGGLGGAMHLLSPGWRKAVGGGLLWVLIIGFLQIPVTQILKELSLDFIPDAMYGNFGGLTWYTALIVFAIAVILSLRYSSRGVGFRARWEAQSEGQKRRNGLILAVALLLAAAVLPAFLGSFLNDLLSTVGLFLLMGLGLNIVVGLAGLLDLGYVAFFAVGAYATAVLTSPGSPALTPQLTFILAILFVVLAAAIAGIFVGTPVIRMRGDYLAIVTLGFGEIARIMLGSDWLKPVFGGAQGILQIPAIELGPITIRGTDNQAVLYIVFAFLVLTVYVSWRLQESRVGRAWMAMREDEQVAEVMGINTVQAKLLAFVVGAIMASFGGALFASKIGSVFPNSFELEISLIVLVLIIVGGMGSIPGVAVGALVLIGVLGGPRTSGLLREFEEFKLLIYGALLIFMMLKRPEGLVPSKRRAQELHQEEFMQDAWLRGETEDDEGSAEPLAESAG